MRRRRTATWKRARRRDRPSSCRERRAAARGASAHPVGFQLPAVELYLLALARDVRLRGDDEALRRAAVPIDPRVDAGVLRLLALHPLHLAVDADRVKPAGGS